MGALLLSGCLRPTVPEPLAQYDVVWPSPSLAPDAPLRWPEGVEGPTIEPPPDLSQDEPDPPPVEEEESCRPLALDGASGAGEWCWQPTGRLRMRWEPRAALQGVEGVWSVSAPGADLIESDGELVERNGWWELWLGELSGEETVRFDLAVRLLGSAYPVSLQAP